MITLARTELGEHTVESGTMTLDGGAPLSFRLITIHRNVKLFKFGSGFKIQEITPRYQGTSVLETTLVNGGKETGFSELFGAFVDPRTGSPITGVEIFNKINTKNIIKGLNQRINDVSDKILQGQQIQSIEVTFNVVGTTNKQIAKDIKSAQRQIVANTKEKYGDQVKVDFKVNENAGSNSVNFNIEAKEVKEEG